MRLLDRMLEMHAPEDLQRVFNLIAFERRQYLDTKADLCDMLLKHLQRCGSTCESDS